MFSYWDRVDSSQELFQNLVVRAACPLKEGDVEMDTESEQ